MELYDQLEEQGYDEAVITEKVAAYRSQLLSKEVRNHARYTLSPPW